MSSHFGHTILKILSNHTPSKAILQDFKRTFALFKTRDKVKEISPYIIVRADKDEYNEVLNVMHESYYPEEPTCYSLKIAPNPILDERAMKAMEEGFTLVAKCKYNGCIVGACINESTSPWDPEMEEKLACAVKCDKLKKLLMFYAYMMRAPDLWRCLGVQKVYEMSYAFVKRSHRKKGLAYKLLSESKSLGADAGFPVVRCDATNIYTAKICERLGMKKVAEIPYCTYLDQNLEPIFKPPWPHEGVKIFCDCSPQFHEINRKIQKKSNIFGFRKKSKEKEQEV
ncbi:dopamine N-acetyltransferase-like [Sitophilus oryzae]|uniref:aralkylamine N-acetyltransferase n=1 Tax=Sitophilus oryzae TaxID=7048 RepID=A0A6J2XPH3_SITOR|nr:dopamine N-acetyltransferase-like [Sitophilus oryzae]